MISMVDKEKIEDVLDMLGEPVLSNDQRLRRIEKKLGIKSPSRTTGE